MLQFLFRIEVVHCAVPKPRFYFTRCLKKGDFQKIVIFIIGKMFGPLLLAGTVPCLYHTVVNCTVLVAVKSLASAAKAAAFET